MGLTDFLDSINESLEYQYDHEKKSDKTAQPRLFITFSRQPGAGGITVSEKVAEILNNNKKFKWPTPWTVFDKYLVKTVLEEHNLPETCEKYMPEGTISPISNILDELFGVHPSAISLVRRTNETMLHLAHLGNTIIVARGGNIVTRKLKGGFHIRLVGSLNKRIKHIMEYSKLDEKQAEEYIVKEEKGRKKYLKEYFNKDNEDSLIYDLVLNTDFISFDDTAKIIVYSALCSGGFI